MRDNRLLVLGALLALAGCQCLEPVEDRADGGSGGARDAGPLDAGPGWDANYPHDAGSWDAGTDGGADAGTPPQCTTAAQCTGALPQSLCNFGGDAGYSCIDNRCVFECTKGRACTVDAGAACLDCTEPAATSCVAPGCGAAVMQGHVESSTTGCVVGFTDVMLTPSGGCTYYVTDATGARGTITRLASGEYVGRFSGFGTCVGVSNFGQVERVLFSCEGCQFVLRI